MPASTGRVLILGGGSWHLGHLLPVVLGVCRVAGGHCHSTSGAGCLCPVPGRGGEGPAALSLSPVPSGQRCPSRAPSVPPPAAPRALLESQAGRDSSAEREKNQNKSQHGCFFFLSFFFLRCRPSSQPLLCHPRWNASPNSSLARCVLLPALPLIVRSDCAFPTLGITARHRRGSVPAPHQPQLHVRAQAGAKRSPGSRRALRGSALTHT